MQIPGKRIDPDEDVYTEPFARGGDGMFLRAQLISKDGAIAATSDLTIVVQSRDTEDSWASAQNIATLEMDVNNAAGTVTEKHIPVAAGVTGIQEQLRLKISGASAGWAVIRVFPPLFYDTAST